MTVSIALIDGDHHPEAVRDALAGLGRRTELRGAVFCGGEEKLAPEVLLDPSRHYGVRVEQDPEPAVALRRLAAEPGVTEVVDLADEPALDPAASSSSAGLAVRASRPWRPRSRTGSASPD